MAIMMAMKRSQRYSVADARNQLASLVHDVEAGSPVEITRRVLTNGSIYIGMAQLTAGQQFLSALPYLATIVVLVLISRNKRLTLMNTPASLAQPFVPDR